MQKWEYMVLKQTRFSKSLHDSPNLWEPKVNLNGLGSEGWELVSVIPLSANGGDWWSGVTNEVTWVFKRPVE